MRILLTGGGSGGSAAPVIAVAQALQRLRQDSEFLYLGTRSGPEELLVRGAGLPFEGIPAGRLRRSATLKNLGMPYLVGAGLALAWRRVRQFHPDVALGAGGFGTLAPLVAARLQRVPIVVHQQDALPGLANRILAPLASQVTVALPETASRFRRPALVVGNPVRAEFTRGDAARGRSCFGIEPDLPVVLVTGGGTGAVVLNQMVAAAAADLVQVGAVVHLTGMGKAAPVDQPGRYHQLEFVATGMEDLLAAADVLVSRAGMSALSEIAAMKKAAIVVPMPASHQEANAAVFQRHGAGLAIAERDLTPARLVAEVRALLDDVPRRQAMGAAAARLLPPDAAEAIASRLAALLEGG